MAQELPTLSKSKRIAATNALSAYAPSITNSSGTTSSSYTASDFALDSNVFVGGAMTAAQFPSQTFGEDVTADAVYQRILGAPMRTHNFGNKQLPQLPKENKVAEKVQNQRRIVKVIMIDPDPAMPIADCVLVSGDEKLTELDDQELFYELNINELLAKHNAKRVLVTDKKASDKAGRDIKLEPARVRDLRMSVVEVAAF